MNLKNIKNAFKWEGLKKELPWIILFIFLLLLLYFWNSDTGSCRKMMNTQCFKQCQFNEYLAFLKEKYPTATFTCDEKTFTCTIHGVQDTINIPGFMTNGT